jgi:hypothetical protein
MLTLAGGAALAYGRFAPGGFGALARFATAFRNERATANRSNASPMTASRDDTHAIATGVAPNTNANDTPAASSDTPTADASTAREPAPIANPERSPTSAPATVAPVAISPRPAPTGRLRDEPTHQDIARIASAIQSGIDTCLAGHRPIGRHVFIGVAYDGPTGTPVTVAVRGAAASEDIAQCIEAHARTVTAEPVARRWVQSFHLRLP